jgi:hypothetical protein
MPSGTPCRVGRRAGWDTVRRATPCRVGTVLVGVPSLCRLRCSRRSACAAGRCKASAPPAAADLTTVPHPPCSHCIPHDVRGTSRAACRCAAVRRMLYAASVPMGTECPPYRAPPEPARHNRESRLHVRHARCTAQQALHCDPALRAAGASGPTCSSFSSFSTAASFEAGRVCSGRIRSSMYLTACCACPQLSRLLKLVRHRSTRQYPNPSRTTRRAACGARRTRRRRRDSSGRSATGGARPTALRARHTALAFACSGRPQRPARPSGAFCQRGYHALP